MDHSSAVAASLAAAFVGGAFCAGHFGATSRGAGSDSSDSSARMVSDEGSSLAGYNRQLRQGGGGANYSTDDPPFIADVWLHG